ncbi:zinc-finger homeodomain protein 11-like [Mercurialis annua]|uniref:zinc-finger homeodomain protein 11-like n=1 Tax=Mercurialis annua TaxID=3986 RepID=UPI00215DEDC4|nr:zinc-finger homeodomain protein 11-like [Mercurialis annua]
METDLYKECLRNHAASLGSYATDGCGEFTLDDSSPSFLHCAACGCHRNFHRKVTSRSRSNNIHHTPTETTSAMMEFMDYGDHTGAARRQLPPVVAESGGGRSEGERSGKMKRFRTKFTSEQKEKMLGFAEKLGWRLQRKDEEDEVERFCRGVGISRQVFKIWMHNHKNSSGSSSVNSTGNNASSLTTQ